MIHEMESKFVRQLRVKDPADRAAALLTLAESRAPAAINFLVRTLQDKDLTMRQTAADTLEAISWRARNPRELALYHTAREDWEDVVDIGPSATPVLTWAIKDKYWEIIRGGAWVLDELGWQPQSAKPKDQAFYFMAKRQWDSLAALGPNAIPALARVIECGDIYDLRAASKVLESLDSPKAYRLLGRLRRHEDLHVR